MEVSGSNTQAEQVCCCNQSGWRISIGIRALLDRGTDAGNREMKATVPHPQRRLAQ